MAATSSNAVQPIAFDNTDQVDAQLQRLEQRIELHVQQVSKGKDKAFADQIRAILREVGFIECYHVKFSLSLRVSPCRPSQRLSLGSFIKTSR